jgi:hypothetical protein
MRVDFNLLFNIKRLISYFFFSYRKLLYPEILSINFDMTARSLENDKLKLHPFAFKDDKSGQKDVTVKRVDVTSKIVDDFEEEAIKDEFFELVHYVEPVYDEFLAKQQKLLTQKNLKLQLYLTEPKQRFRSLGLNEKLYNVMRETFENRCKVYEPNEAKYSCRLVCDRARVLAKSLKLDRYKYVINTVVLQKLGQSVIISSSVLSSPNSDGYVYQKYEANDFVVICLIHAMYHE